MKRSHSATKHLNNQLNFILSKRMQIMHTRICCENWNLNYYVWNVNWFRDISKEFYAGSMKGKVQNFLKIFHLNIELILSMEFLEILIRRNFLFKTCKHKKNTNFPINLTTWVAFLQQVSPQHTLRNSFLRLMKFRILESFKEPLDCG